MHSPANYRGIYFHWLACIIWILYMVATRIIKKRRQKYGLMNKKMHSLYHTTPVSITSHPRTLPVNLSEHQVHSTNDSDRVRQEVVPHHKVRSSQVGETGCSDLALVRAVGAVGNEVDTHLTLGGFDSSVCFSGRNRVTFREDLKRR